MTGPNQNPVSEKLRDDAAAFVLGAMPEIEAQAFRREMMKDCELGRYVERLEAVGDVLLTSAPPVAVPDGLGDAIVAEARRDLAARELLQSPRGGAVAEQKSPSFLDRLFKPAVGLGLAVLIAAFAFVAGQNFTGDDTRTTPVASFKPMEAPDVSGSVKLMEGGADGAMVEISGLDPSIGDDTYQLWVLKDGQVSPSSLFAVDDAGHGNSAVMTDMTGAEAVMVTREPAGGSPQPTSDVLARADV